MEQQCLHPGGLAFTARLLKYAAVPAGAAVLDAGCGAGHTVRWLKQEGYHPYGIDRMPSMQSQTVCQGELTEMPYQAEQFAAVLCECTAFISGNPAAMLQECHRVLQQQGWLLLADVYFSQDKPLPAFTDGRPVTMEQWQELLQKTGFVVRRVEDVSAAWKPFVMEQLWAGRTLEELWGGCWGIAQTAANQYKPGYFLLWAQKGEAEHG